MVGDRPPPSPPNDDKPVEVNSGPAPPGITQEDWDAYCREVVRAWRKRPFKWSDDSE
jgi:hypothetical protein